jgi:hypothetical protein
MESADDQGGAQDEALLQRRAEAADGDELEAVSVLFCTRERMGSYQKVDVLIGEGGLRWLVG